MISVILSVLLLLLAAIFHSYKKQPSKKLASKRLPTLPIIGSAHLFFSREILKTLTDFSREFSEPFTFKVFLSNYYYTQDVEEIRTFLTNPKTIEKGHLYHYFEWIIPNSLVLANEAIWKKKRRCFSKGFSQRKLINFVTIFDKCAIDFTKSLHTKEDVPLLKHVEINITEVFMKIMIGLDLQTADEEIKDLYKRLDPYYLMKSIPKIAVERHVKPWLYFDLIFLATEKGKDCTNRSENLRKILRRIIADRKTKPVNCENGYSDDVDKLFVDLMVEGNLTEKDILTETLVFATAATETTGITLSAAFTLLGMYPDVQKKLYEEVIEAFGDRQSLDHNDLLKLKYTEMVLKETMRLFPAIPIILRLTTADLNLGNKVIPENTNLVINIYDIHRSEKYWKDPLKFDPDRFLPEKKDESNPLPFLAFSSGPRNCIGAKYSMLQMKTILAHVTKEFELSSNTQRVADIVLESYMTPVVKEGIHCVFTPRAKN